MVEAPQLPILTCPQARLVSRNTYPRPSGGGEGAEIRTSEAGPTSWPGLLDHALEERTDHHVGWGHPGSEQLAFSPVGSVQSTPISELSSRNTRFSPSTAMIMLYMHSLAWS